MNVKTKLLSGALSAVVGLSLVGGGTYAAFNDVETTTAKVEAGKLDLAVNPTVVFDVNNLKPGDYMEKTFQLQNRGTLAIKDVLMSLGYSNFIDFVKNPNGTGPQTGGTNSALEFLEQFELSVVTVGAEGGSGGFPKTIIGEGAHITLADVYKATNSSYTGGDKSASAAKIVSALGTTNAGYWRDGRLNVATINPDEWTGVPVTPHDPDDVKFKITFKDDSKKTNGVYDQNIFQGDSIKVQFELEARQWQGLDVQTSDQDANGYITSNEKANNGR